MGGNDKAEFRLALGTFEPELGNCEWLSHPLKKHHVPPFTVAVKMFESSSMGHFPITAHPHHRSPRSLSHCLKKLYRAKLRISLYNNHPALTLARLERLLTTCMPVVRDWDVLYPAIPENSKALAIGQSPDTT